MPIGLHHLRYFVAVAEEGHVTRAAHRLRLAQPSLSAQIRYLERQTGVTLFHRHSRGVELTEAGVAFLAEARAALTAADAAVDAARRAAHPKRRYLRVGFIVGTQVEPTSALLHNFRTRRPEVELDLVEHTFADPSAGLNSGDVDVAFVMPPISHHGLRFETLYSAPRVAVLPASHPLAGRPAVSVRELFDEPWIVADTDDDVCRDFWLATRHRTGPPVPGRRTRSIDKFIQLVAAAEVVGLAAAWVEPIFARPGIAFVPVRDVEPATTALAWRPEPPDPLVEAFVRLAREARDALGMAGQLNRSAQRAAGAAGRRRRPRPAPGEEAR
jgi:DNA-binding transcriptional LysR family regulator